MKISVFVSVPGNVVQAGLLNMSRLQLPVVIGLLTGHLGLNGHLHRIGKDINPVCRCCLNGNETVM